MINNITEADYLESTVDLSIENSDFDEDYFREIEEDQNRREQKLIGKYVIICNGVKSKKLCYLQDSKISSKGYWTNFLSNAIGFKTKEGAIKKVKSIKYNNPKVRLIDVNLKLVEV